MSQEGVVEYEGCLAHAGQEGAHRMNHIIKKVLKVPKVL